MKRKRTDIVSCQELRNSPGAKCPLCGYRYDPNSVTLTGYDNGRRHRRFHTLNVPWPLPELNDFPPGDIRVGLTSPDFLHALVYKYARALRRQEGYDFTQWNPARGLPDNDFEKGIHAWLLVPEKNLAVGAAGFSWNLWTNHAPSWCLNFIWIAGSWRRKGLLRARWPQWRSLYGAFMVEPPWSDDMKEFLGSKGVENPPDLFKLADEPPEPPEPLQTLPWHIGHL